jgi:hypothetical protein
MAGVQAVQDVRLVVRDTPDPLLGHEHCNGWVRIMVKSSNLGSMLCRYDFESKYFRQKVSKMMSIFTQDAALNAKK